MREDWSATKLGNLIAKRDDFTPVVADDEYVILGVQRSGWGFVEREPIRGSDMKFTKLMQVEEDDLVYRTITAFEAPSAVVGPNQAGRFVTPQTFPVFRIDDTQLLPAYMKLLTTSEAFHQEMSKRCTGSVLRRKTLSVGAFLSIPIDLPPLAEQRRIVDLIGALDETIAAADDMETQLESERAALSSSLWLSSETVPLSSIGTLITGATPPTKDESMWSSNDVPFVTPGDMPWTGAPIEQSERFVSSHAAKVSKRVLNGSGVLQVCIGATVGKVGLLEGPALFNQQINAVLDLDRTDAMVLAASLASPEFQAGIRRRAGSSTMPLVSKRVWGELDVAWPNRGDRLLWADLLTDVFSAKAHLRSAAEQLRELRSNMLTALLSGEHEIPESYNAVMEAAA